MRLFQMSTAVSAISWMIVAGAGFSEGCGGAEPTAKTPRASGQMAASASGVDAGTSDQVLDSKGHELGVATAPAEAAQMSGPAREAYDHGWAAWRNGDLNEAKKSFQEAIQKDPNAAAAHYSLGAVVERLGDRIGAADEYRAAYTVKPSDDHAVGAYAILLANTGRAGEADAFLTERQKQAPTSARLTAYLAEVKSIANDSGTAQQLAQEALHIDPDLKEAMVTIARDHYRARRIDLARYALQAILDGFGEGSPPRDKDNAEAHLLRGLIERENNERAAAMIDFDAARTRRPDLVEALVQLGVMKLEAGNASEAGPLLESAVKYAPNNAIVHVNLADAYRLLGRFPEAKGEFDRALSLDSTLAAAHYDLGLLYLFAPAVPGLVPVDQVAAAMKELELYKTMRAKVAQTGGDDVDELLARAKNKLAELKGTSESAAAPTSAHSAADAGAKK